MKRLRALIAAGLIACSLIVVNSTADDILRAVCAGLGPDHPLYDYLGCPAVMHQDPQG